VHPFNCGLDHLVHESKGCYVGQEILTRMRSRNNTGKSLILIEGQPDDATTTGKTHSLAIRRN
jgi:folate-binding Fe-S cluster repair protein YgfZ